MFFVFIDSGRSYDHGNGSLEDHLSYLKMYNGTPDFYTNPTNIREAVEDAVQILEDPSITRVAITDVDYNIIDYVEDY